MSATKKIKEKITENPSEEELREFAISDGMTTLKQDTIIKILEGITSTEEARRVLGELKKQNSN
jgi:type II secretory ATPase GspE/PulE/Tfp pilus assembly ATPase PilB-like protein